MIERLAEQIFNDLRNGAAEFSGATDSGSSKLKSMIEAKLRKLNIVSREEFDAQTAVLTRTRAKLDALEKEIETLNTLLNKTPSDHN